MIMLNLAEVVLLLIGEYDEAGAEDHGKVWVGDHAYCLVHQGKVIFTTNMESSIFLLKTQLDQNFGCTWHVVVGEDFAVDIDFEVWM